MRLIVPALDPTPWPTLGPEVCDWIEDTLVHGPGDVLGQPITLSDEVRLYIYRLYEVYPRGHELAGRRRFKRCFLSRRKGFAKTEIADFVALAELDNEAPVRCDGWRKEDGAWIPVGRPVSDPFVLMLAYTEQQADDLAYGGAKKILENCALGDKYDIGEERIMFADSRIPGEMKAIATAPSAADGARTTHQNVDEPHLWILPRHHKTHRTILNNTAKRYDGDAWTHETSTMYGPGEGSIAEQAHELALAMLRGEMAGSQLYYDHRQASEKWDISKQDELIEAIKEASGDALGYADVHSIAGLLGNIDMDGQNFRRFWLNQPASLATRMFDVLLWDQHAVLPKLVKPQSRVVLFFDGSYSRDSTALMGATVEADPYLFVVEAWERPLDNPAWRTPRLQVDAAVDQAMNTWRVLELACDPPGWVHEIEEWQEIYGDVVTRFETAKPSLMGPAADTFVQRLKGDAGEDGEDVGWFTHDGDARLRRHIANCVPEARRGGYIIPTKESEDSTLKIDLAIASIGALARALWHHVNDAPGEKWVFTSKR